MSASCRPRTRFVHSFHWHRSWPQKKARKDAAIRDVFTGDSDKFLVIIGPCSADREDAVIDYVNRLAKVQEKVKDKLILVPRIYTNKPRTTGDGYKDFTPAKSGR